MSQTVSHGRTYDELIEEPGATRRERERNAPMLTPETPQIAWRLSGVSDHDFMRRWSLQHRAPVGAETTLCGIRIPWHRVGPGDARRCQRCERAEAKQR